MDLFLFYFIRGTWIQFPGLEYGYRPVFNNFYSKIFSKNGRIFIILVSLFTPTLMQFFWKGLLRATEQDSKYMTISNAK